MSVTNNAAIARAWITAFNAHDVAALLALYDEGCTHTSPKIRARSPETGGKVIGRAALGQWWRDAIAATPGLRYEPTAIVADDRMVIIEYVRHASGAEPMPIAETFEIADGRIVASRVYHG